MIAGTGTSEGWYEQELPQGGMVRVHPLPFGAEYVAGQTRFRIFAPAVESVQLKLEHTDAPLEMVSEGDGWFVLTTSEAPPGTRYRYKLPDGFEVPDPASRFQPENVSGPSEVIDPAFFLWKDGGWAGREWSEAVLYELHVGTFTEEGTFHSAMSKLDHLADLGVTAIELMCLADFAGDRNWGYDGVLIYAPDSAYGRPEDLKSLVDAAHSRGLMIILDVVYNHLGPEGNYLPRYFPQFCQESEHTPWGHALNFSGEYSEVVRELIVQNALYWVEEFHVDGLRLDAAHAMIDKGPKHILLELAERVRALVGERRVHLILEDEVYVPELLQRDDAGEARSYTAQWNHDMTHLLGASMAPRCIERLESDDGETERLGQALSCGFVISAEKQGRRGIGDRVLPTAFICFLQTHDLIGNRIFGDRIFAIASPEAVRAAYAVLLLLPQVPMIFMGDEFGASSPFPFFCDFHGELADAVRKGRCDQFAELEPAPDPEALKRAPDPEAESTFLSGKLRWDEANSPEHAVWLTWFKRVLRLRRESVVPLLEHLGTACGSYRVVAPGALICEWESAGGVALRLEANLCGQANDDFLSTGDRDVFWMEGTADNGGRFGPWSVRWSRLDQQR